jgi:predicted enzyme related to lactoylglutathione lyase
MRVPGISVRPLSLTALGAAAVCAAWLGVAAPQAAAPAAEVAGGAGRFVWQDLITQDAARCRGFYGQWLGWEFSERTREGKPYLVASLGGSPFAGIVEVKDPRVARAAWLSYLTVDDLEQSIARIQSAGGKLLVGPAPVGAYGRAAVVTDPQGAPLGLAGLTKELPAGPADPVQGRFFWREYFARDAAKALDFYTGLGGYQDTLGKDRGPVEYHVLVREGPRAGLFQLPSEWSDVQPNWLPYIKADDPAALASKAEALGGRILLAPQPNVRGGTVAIVQDPTGGTVALQKWPL